MAEAKKTNYGNESISSLKGADRVRKRPGVIFGSDGLDGCEHAVFEILSNSIDEAREGHGKLITVTRYLDHSIEVEDMGRGCPVDYNPKEKRFNWELVYCELYAGGKYNNLDGDNYEYSLGLNGLGACATQYSSRYMDVTVWRDGNKYSLHFERGKILNCLKADYPRIFKSEIITDLLKVLGCGVEVPGKFVKDLNAFDINNLRWNKVILCTDADVDGFQIRTLILTMIYRLCPTLIREGYVYIAETPLFEITCGEKTWFAYTDKEKNDIVKTLEGKRYKVDRSKGLGQNDPEMMWLTTMNPETRRLIKVMPEDAEATAHSFDLLLGDNLQGRKDHIAENGYKYLEMIDVS